MTARHERGGFGFAVVVMVMLVLLTGVLLTAMRKAEGCEDEMRAAVDRAVAYVVAKTGYSTEGLHLRWKFVSAENLFYMAYPPPPNADADWYTYERAVRLDGPRPQAMTAQSMMYFIEDMDLLEMEQVIVHEVVHVLQFLNGVPPCAAGKSVEHEAYKVQEAWLTENGIPESDWIMPGPLSRMVAEQCPRRE
jgi:hypothetical protein